VGRKAGELAPTGGHCKDVYVKTPVGWRFKKRDFIPSTSGADPAPVAPPSIPSDTAPIGTRAPLAAAANFVAPTQQSSLSATDYLEIAQLVASYGHALDSGYGKGENGEAYAGLYTADASFAGATGHDQLVRLGQIPASRSGLCAPLPDESRDRTDARRRERQGISHRHRQRRKRQSELVVSRRPLRRHVREDAARLANQDASALSAAVGTAGSDCGDDARSISRTGCRNRRRRCTCEFAFGERYHRDPATHRTVRVRA
jgi:hypothetical protein